MSKSPRYPHRFRSSTPARISLIMYIKVLNGKISSCIIAFANRVTLLDTSRNGALVNLKTPPNEYNNLIWNFKSSTVNLMLYERS